MDTHKNASLRPKGREAITRSVIEGGLSKEAAARQFNTTPETVAKWVGRFCAEGVAGLQDRSSKPRSSPSQTAPAVCAAVEALRRQRHTGAQIAAEVGVSAATISRILERRGLNRLSALEPAEPVRRYERAAPGEIVHIDIKKLGKFNRIGRRITGDRTGQSNTRGVGWEHVHLAIDDHSRLAYSEIPPDAKRTDERMVVKHSLSRRASPRDDEALVRHEPRPLPGTRPQRLPSQVRRHGDEHEAGARAHGEGLIGSGRGLGEAPGPARLNKRSQPGRQKSSVSPALPPNPPAELSKPGENLNSEKLSQGPRRVSWSAFCGLAVIAGLDQVKPGNDGEG